MITEKKNKEGHFIGLAIAMALPISIPLGMILGNIVFGFLVTMPVALATGVLLEKKWNKHPVPLSEFERTRQRRKSGIGIIVGLVLLLLLTMTYFLLRNQMNGL